MEKTTTPATLNARPPPGAPPAIWAAFARASAWKSWALVLQFFVIGVLLLANLRLARKEPDVVVVTPDGKGSYLERSAANAALLEFLAEQKAQPSELTMLRFAREFLTLTQAVNSSTFEEAWPAALRLMSPGLRERFSLAAREQKLIEAHRAAQVRTAADFEDLSVLDRRESLARVRATVRLTKARLVDGERLTTDRVSSELVLRTVPRTPDRPDGLEVVEWRVRVLKEASTSSETKENSNVP